MAFRLPAFALRAAARSAEAWRRRKAGSDRSLRMKSAPKPRQKETTCRDRRVSRGGPARDPGVMLTSLALALSGFAAMGMEILWFRHFSILLGGFRAVFALLLAVILIGIGAGSLLGGFLDRRIRRPGPCLMVVQATLRGVALPALPARTRRTIDARLAIDAGPVGGSVSSGSMRDRCSSRLRCRRCSWVSAFRWPMPSFSAQSSGWPSCGRAVSVQHVWRRVWKPWRRLLPVARSWCAAERDVLDDRRGPGHRSALSGDARIESVRRVGILVAVAAALVMVLLLPVTHVMDRALPRPGGARAADHHE